MVGIPSSINPTICGHTITVGDEIGVFTPGGLCVGTEAWTGSNITITVWGDDDQTPEVDGIRTGEQMQFRVRRKLDNTEYIAYVRDSLDMMTYIKNYIYHVSSLVANVQAVHHFTYTSNTGHKAIIAIRPSINPTIGGVAIAVGDEIGVFTPGGLCVGADVWTGSNIAITVWEDDDETTAVDGIQPGEQMQFRVWRKSTNTEYPAQVTYTKGTSTYAAKGIYKLGSLIVPMRVKVKVFLQGPYSGGVMTTTLNSLGFIPLNSNTAYNDTTYSYRTKSVRSIPNANVVDWVLVELRSGTAASTKVETQAAFLLNDGTVVDVDGLRDLEFNVATAGNYYIVIRHRNHLAVMSAAAVTLPNASAYDFTLGQGQAYDGTTPMKDLTGAFGMWAGDANGDGIVKFSGPSNDQSVLIGVLGTANLGMSKSGYYGSDLNLDGQVKFSGPSNDRSILIGLLGTSALETKVP
jgi:hypothetical protein